MSVPNAPTMMILWSILTKQIGSLTFKWTQCPNHWEFQVDNMFGNTKMMQNILSLLWSDSLNPPDQLHKSKLLCVEFSF